MGQINTRDVVLLANTVATTNGVGPDIIVPQGWQAATISVTVSTSSGTSPTLNVFLQKLLNQAATTDSVGNMPTGTAIHDDILAFTQITSTNPTRLCNICTGPQTPTANSTVITTADYALADATLTAGDVRVGPIGGTWRVKFTIGGTSPSFTFSVVANLIPFST